MQIAADVSEISKTVQHDITFILNVLSESSIRFASFQQFLLKGMLLVSHKMVLTKTRLCYYAQLCGNVQEHLQLQSSV